MKSFKTRLANQPAKTREEADAYRQMLQLGSAIRVARVEREWSQDELTERSQVAQGDISKIENGTLAQGPTAMTLCRLAQALGMQVALAPVNTSSVEPSTAAFESIHRDLATTMDLIRKMHDELGIQALERAHEPLDSNETFAAGKDVLSVQLVRDPKVQQDLQQLVGHLSESIRKTENAG